MRGIAVIGEGAGGRPSCISSQENKLGQVVWPVKRTVGGFLGGAKRTAGRLRQQSPDLPAVEFAADVDNSADGFVDLGFRGRGAETEAK